MDEQDEHLERVSLRIAGAIRAFCDARADGDLFHVDDVRKVVLAQVGPVAPASPDRILRDLRQRGLIDYEVVSRRDSLYRIVRKPRQLALI